MSPLSIAFCNSNGAICSEDQQKISSYADDVLLFLSDPESSVPAIVDLIQEFGQFSRYKINFSKSVALFIGNKKSINQPYSFPFKYPEDDFIYSGNNIIPTFRKLFTSA